jgi:hypothetical protein
MFTIKNKLLNPEIISTFYTVLFFKFFTRRKFGGKKTKGFGGLCEK